MLNNKKTINAWCMYDWANSVYSLTITSAVFPIYYQAVAVNANGGDTVRFFGVEVVNSVLYSYALSVSFLLVAIMLPILSGIADYAGKKKFFLKVFMFLGSFSCIGLFFFTGKNIEWGILCSVLASIGYSGSLVFYDAFLNEIVTVDQRDIVSAKGYSYGYLGGVILLVINLLVITFYDAFGLPGEGVASRVAFLTVGVWWIVFSLYAMSKLPENPHDRKPKGYYLTNGYRELRHVWKQLKEMDGMRKYLLAFFFYNMGVQTVMYLAATFGSKELKLSADKLIMTILLIQFLGIAGAYFFAYLSKRKGNVQSLLVTIVIWIFCCVYAYFVTEETQFYALAAVVGLIMGGIQALSRATFSKIMPVDTVDTASFFSFYDVTFNLSIVIGTFVYGYIEQVTGSMRNSTLALASFFVIGMIFLSQVKLKSVKTQTADVPS
ncbi:MFS transporter [Fulvivirga sp. M361]|uniref:MFS transporter n=1 Tax=Fulvivirga sp. M361 TaxID=2594266 RepID=UPI00117BDC15|nr:MFS transporter [Fulvivirga sp. M361]TRX58851.1 MFS transporter [Fulvivirga sp. M361]